MSGWRSGPIGGGVTGVGAGPSRDAVHRIVLQEPSGQNTDVKAVLTASDAWRLFLVPFMPPGPMNLARLAFELRAGAATSYVTAGVYRITNGAQIDPSKRSVAGLQLGNMHLPAMEASLIARAGTVQLPAGTGNYRTCVFDLEADRRLTPEGGPFAIGLYSERVDIAFPYCLTSYWTNPMFRSDRVMTRPDDLPLEATCRPPSIAEVSTSPVMILRSRLGVRMHPLVGPGAALV